MTLRWLHDQLKLSISAHVLDQTAKSVIEISLRDNIEDRKLLVLERFQHVVIVEFDTRSIDLTKVSVFC